jgi:predicted nucleic acid-binding protein
VTVVVDASVVVAALVDSGADGQWAESVLVSGPLAAPETLLVEVANVLRRAARADQVSADVASLAHADLLDLRIDLVAYEAVAARAWELRDNLSVYDGWYVAVAEALDAPLATLDRRLSTSPGARCEFVLPT